MHIKFGKHYLSECGPRPVSLASLRNLQMHIVRPHRGLRIRSSVVGPAIWVLISPPDNVCVCVCVYVCVCVCVCVRERERER
jgi:hypothetical protein